MRYYVSISANIAVEADSADEVDAIVLNAVGTSGIIEDYLVREASQDIGLSG